MDLPTARELELESALRQRNKQITELTDEVTRLRAYISNNPPAPSETIHVPPALIAALQPHIENEPSSTVGRGSVTTALSQRVKTLQDENDELYDILKKSETGRLKEEVQTLSNVVTKLDTALRESHKVIQCLSNELDQTHDTFARNHDLPKPKPSPRNHYSQRSVSSASSVPSSKLPPTGPRSHKKQRVSSDNQSKSDDKRRHNTHSHPHSSSTKMDVDKLEKERDDHDGNRSRKTTAPAAPLNGIPTHPRNGLGGGRRTNGGTLAERMAVDNGARHS
ncbi:hypothetical protein CYLTODRAFT_484844 [Cylindrobasidium torrendii FP15055 ss-10]|uniref:Uncharacterized protein n=1 Tax=Cylindrobasidium torrendii FP15055 ss-10 TaxID=1314674 RepID=A0A0D7BUI5_9AGAR|nr:hypothetical protein CYLTODRAFT_484844 [Cylindrobasidium torrendii FP15055 ss-10]